MANLGQLGKATVAASSPSLEELAKCASDAAVIIKKWTRLYLS